MAVLAAVEPFGVAAPARVVTDVRGLVERVKAVGGAAGDWSALERREVLAALDAAVGALTVVRGEVLLAERDSGTWRASGDPSFEAWRGRTSRSGARAVLTQVRQADAATRLPQFGDAAREGAVTVDHMEALGRVVAGASGAVKDALASPERQAQLVETARRVDAGTFARAVAQLAAEVDPLAHERGHQAQRAARFLTLADTPEGTRIKGLVDRMAGHRLRLALEAVSPRPGKDDDRSHEQRRADALDTIAEKILALPETGSGAAVRPHVSFLMDAQTWAGLRALRAAGKLDATGAAASGATEHLNPDTASFAPVTLEDGTPVPISEVARALCDCDLTRVVMDADTMPLDIGRTQRTYTGVQRRAVIARDRGCSWPDCGAEARWGEVHHIRWWERDNGPTSLTNGVLLCVFHHHEVHRRDLTITRQPGPGRRPRYTFRDQRGRPVAVPGDARASLDPARAAEPSGAAGPSRGDEAGEIARASATREGGVPPDLFALG
ncbi:MULTISPECIES: HNH endonuclease signature motif containing protein [unclassified Actinotalea]|uniref:HNH endonuclease signature motif containing protein n=1 Tax=unclassified Actinotalea TaxID=2638618 RepID=UPI0015F64F7A|nr:MULTISPECIES: HNH endonuclease signature motif containing protein [unclassified Actinotalea]